MARREYPSVAAERTWWGSRRDVDTLLLPDAERKQTLPDRKSAVLEEEPSFFAPPRNCVLDTFNRHYRTTPFRRLRNRVSCSGGRDDWLLRVSRGIRSNESVGISRHSCNRSPCAIVALAWMFEWINTNILHLTGVWPWIFVLLLEIAPVGLVVGGFIFGL